MIVGLRLRVDVFCANNVSNEPEGRIGSSVSTGSARIMREPTSVSLLCRVRDQADTESWREFAELYYDVIQRWLCAQGVHPHDADDVAQEVMSYVSNQLSSFEHNGRRGAFRSWLRRITSNRLREFWRKRDRRRTTGPDLGEMADELAERDSALSQVWKVEHDRYVLDHLLATVADRFQGSSLAAFRRVVLEECPAAEVADELGMSIGAVRVAQSRVLKALREVGEGLVE